MVEYDIPAMIHVSTSCNPCFHTTGAHYLNADTTAFMQCLTSNLFRDFPTLRFVIPHGGGAVPYHWGRFRGLAQELKRPPLKEHLLKNIFFDTCVYHQPGIDLLAQVIPVDNVLFASEMIGAVRASIRKPGSTTTTRSATSTPRHPTSRRGPPEDLRGQRAPRLSTARRGAEIARRLSPADLKTGMDPDWLPFHPRSLEARVPAAARRGGRALPRVRAGGAVSVRAGAQSTRPATRPGISCFALRDYLGFERNVIVQATCHGNDNRALVDALRAFERQGARRRLGRARGDRRRTAGHARGRRARHAIQFRAPAGGLHAARRPRRDRAPHRAARLARRRLLRGAGPARVWDFFTTLPTPVVVDHMGRPDPSKAVGGPEFELFMKLMREHPNVWSKVSCPDRLSNVGPPRMTTSCRSRNDWSKRSRSSTVGH